MTATAQGRTKVDTKYIPGQRVRSTVYFEDPTSTTAPVGPNGFTLVDPSIIQAMVHQADETETIYTHGADAGRTVKVSTGVYFIDQDITGDRPNGWWAIRWFCPPGSTVVTATETEFEVVGSAFTNPIP